MRKYTIALIIIAILATGIGITALYFFWDDIAFNPGNRYPHEILDYMDVIYANRSDNYAFNEGYSESDVCPWGFEHNGLDYFLNNDSKVLAASPGQIIEVSWRDNGESVENRFYVRVDIRFNKDIILGYNFEPWTQNPDHKDQQLAMVLVQEGDWVELGQEIARFLYVGSGAHIHFDVSVDHNQACPQQFFSIEGYNEIMAMIHGFNPSWNLCYP